MNRYYILDPQHNVIQTDMKTCAIWLEDFSNRYVGWDQLNGLDISTVFLGLDHSFDNGPPLIFETMIFKHGEPNDLYCERCSTWVEAKAQHTIAIAKVKSGEITA